MADYKISQTPDGSKRASPKRRKVAKRASSRSFNPQLVMGGIVLVLILVFGGLAWAHFFVAKPQLASGSTTAKPIHKPVSAATRSAVTGAIASQQAGNLSAYYGAQVHVVMTKQGINRTLSGAQVSQLINNPLNGAQSPWNWHLPPGDIAAWQTGPYGQYFDGNVIVGQSNDGTVVSVTVDDNGQITTIFVAPVGDLTPPSSGGGANTGAQGTSSGSTGSSGSGTSNGGSTGGSPSNPSTGLGGQYSD
ncbi:MAG: hypothetical protein ABI221_02695 [Candidatus Saccharimonadales bacterium]